MFCELFYDKAIGSGKREGFKVLSHSGLVVSEFGEGSG